MNKLVKNALVLTTITLVAGVALGFVYEITKDAIAQAEHNAEMQADAAVFTDAARFEDEEYFDPITAQTVLADNNIEGASIEGSATAFDNSGNILGHVIRVVGHTGYSGDITLVIGVQEDGTLNGYSIISMGETPGLGTRVEEEEFSSQFHGVNEPNFTVVTTAPAVSNEIEAVSGASISSRAVGNAVNAGLAYFRYLRGLDPAEVGTPDAGSSATDEVDPVQAQSDYQSVMPTASNFADFAGFDTAQAENAAENSGYPGNTINGVVEATDAAGAVVGYIFKVTSHVGYRGDIAMDVGILFDGTVTGYLVTYSQETEGKGSPIATDSSFISQFEGKQVESFVMVTTAPESSNQIEAISGATDSSRALLNGINVALAYFRQM